MDRDPDIYKRSLAFFLKPISTFLDDASVSEIMVNGTDTIYIERGGVIELTDARFPTQDHLMAAVKNVAQYTGKRIASDTSRFDSRLPDGSRVHVVLPPSSGKKIVVAIRKFSRRKLSLERLLELGSLTEEAKEFLELAVALAKNILASGGTSSGKTSLLNALSGAIPGKERIIVLEDSSELQLSQEHVLYFEAQSADRYGKGAVTIRDLFHSSLRLRPDRIVIGEIRGGEALDMIQAMTSGHSGSMSTLHANNPRDALNRLETMALMSGIEIPLFALRSQVASAVDVIVQACRMPDGSRRVTHISEVMPLSEAGKYEVQDLFVYQAQQQNSGPPGHGRLQWMGTRCSFAAELSVQRLDGRVLHASGVFGLGRETENASAVAGRDR
jgi:pilus assembly protein CpaF